MTTPRTDEQVPTAARPAIVIPRRTWLAFAVLILGIAMALLDTTIVNVAVKTLGTDFDTSLATIQWVLTAYTLLSERRRSRAAPE